MTTTLTLTLSLTLALDYASCTPQVTPTMLPWDAPLAELWQSPDRPGVSGTGEGRIATRDLFYGPWGPERAPDPRATYTVIERQREGSDSGTTLRDSHGREWRVQPSSHTDQSPERPIDIVLSRVLSAVGYHQPPVYFQPSLTVADDRGRHVEPGGRFRLADTSIQAIDSWSWQQNPFVGMRPYQGLLVILLLFGGSDIDIENESNVLYALQEPGAGPAHWYVVRDPGTVRRAAGSLMPVSGTSNLFERQVVLGVENGIVRFDYHGLHHELLRSIDRFDVRFAVDLLQQLNGDQWRDAFRAAGYDAATAAPLIAQLHRRIDEADRIACQQPTPASCRVE